MVDNSFETPEQVRNRFNSAISRQRNIIAQNQARLNDILAGRATGDVNQLRKQIRADQKFIGQVEENRDARVAVARKRQQAKSLASQEGISVSQAKRRLNKREFAREAAALKGDDRRRFEAQRREVRALSVVSNAALGASVSGSRLSAARDDVALAERQEAARVARGEQAGGVLTRAQRSQVARFRQGKVNIRSNQSQARRNRDSLVTLSSSSSQRMLSNTSENGSTSAAATVSSLSGEQFFMATSPLSTRRLGNFQFDAGTGVDQPKPDFFRETQAFTNQRLVSAPGLSSGNLTFSGARASFTRLNRRVGRKVMPTSFSDFEEARAEGELVLALPFGSVSTTNERLVGISRAIAPSGSRRANFVGGVADEFRSNPIGNVALFAAGGAVGSVGKGLQAASATSRAAAVGSRAFTLTEGVAAGAFVGTVGREFIARGGVNNPSAFRVLGRESTRLASFATGVGIGRQFPAKSPVTFVQGRQDLPFLSISGRTPTRGRPPVGRLTESQLRQFQVPDRPGTGQFAREPVSRTRAEKQVLIFDEVPADFAPSSIQQRSLSLFRNKRGSSRLTPEFATRPQSFVRGPRRGGSSRFSSLTRDFSLSSARVTRSVGTTSGRRLLVSSPGTFLTPQTISGLTTSQASRFRFSSGQSPATTPTTTTSSRIGFATTPVVGSAIGLGIIGASTFGPRGSGTNNFFNPTSTRPTPFISGGLGFGRVGRSSSLPGLGTRRGFGVTSSFFALETGLTSSKAASPAGGRFTGLELRPLVAPKKKRRKKKKGKR